MVCIYNFNFTHQSGLEKYKVAGFDPVVIEGFSTEESHKGSEGLSGGAIAGIVIAVLVVVVAVVVTAAFIL